MLDQRLLFILPASLITAIIVQVAAYVLPERKSLETSWGQFRSLWFGNNWHSPLSRVRQFVTPRWGLRLLLIWVAAFVILWQAVSSAPIVSQALTLAFIGLYLLTIAIIDFDHHLVLNRMLAVSAPLLIILSLLGFLSPLPSALLGSLIGLALFGLLALIGRGALGMGDVKLAAWIGFVTGYPDVIRALLIGIIAGGIAAAVLLVAKRFQRKQAIAYAPYLALGAWLVLLQQFRSLP
ncbi:MAG: prepilin peptidase [Chloroflexi bacterium]|nr:prepilin peptidase [Chloroflexota bacterium]